MRRATITVTLGGRSWTVRALTLAQLQDIEAVQTRYAAGGLSAIRYSAEVVAVGIGRSDPDAATEVLDMEVETTLGEISAASSAVLRLGGFLPEVAPGEAEAGAAPASTGDASTPA